MENLTVESIEKPKKVFSFEAEVIRILDGDTIEVLLDCGFNIFHSMRIRLFGIDAPEPRGKGKEFGIESLKHLSYLIESKTVTIETIKLKKSYDRYLGKVYLNGEYINQRMIDDGYAVEYNK